MVAGASKEGGSHRPTDGGRGSHRLGQPQAGSATVPQTGQGQPQAEAVFCDTLKTICKMFLIMTRLAENGSLRKKY